MSISFCKECERTVEGNIHDCECGQEMICDFCGGIITELPEEEASDEN